MRKDAAETETAALVHCCRDCGSVAPHTPSPPPSTSRKTPNIQQSITGTHQKSPPPEGCPTAARVCVRRRVAAATPWMQIWMLRGGVSGSVAPGGGWQRPALANCWPAGSYGKTTGAAATQAEKSPSASADGSKRLPTRSNRA